MEDANRVTIISTNCDTSVEQGIFNRLIEMRTSVARHVDFGITSRDAYRDLLHVRPRDAHLALLKLHGSRLSRGCQRHSLTVQLALISFCGQVTPASVMLLCRRGVLKAD